MGKLSQLVLEPISVEKELPYPPTTGVDIFALYNQFYERGSKSYEVLQVHSEMVAQKALQIVDAHPWWGVDRAFVYEAAMLHDIGIFACHAPAIGCRGSEPYIKHGVIGSEILREAGLPEHALVCERHTGVGLTLEAIKRRKLPLPHREMVPVTLEEQIICFADLFYSKSGNLKKAKSVERIRKSLKKHGRDQVKKFDYWCDLFLK